MKDTTIMTLVGSITGLLIPTNIFLYILHVAEVLPFNFSFVLVGDILVITPVLIIVLASNTTVYQKEIQK